MAALGVLGLAAVVSVRAFATPLGSVIPLLVVSGLGWVRLRRSISAELAARPAADLAQDYWRHFLVQLAVPLLLGFSSAPYLGRAFGFKTLILLGAAAVTSVPPVLLARRALGLRRREHVEGPTPGPAMIGSDAGGDGRHA